MKVLKATPDQNNPLSALRFIFATHTEPDAKLSEFLPSKQYSRNNVPPRPSPKIEALTTHTPIN